MEFAGKEYIYLSKLKKEKIKKIRKSEEDNKEEAPIPKLENNNDKMNIEEDDISKKLNKFNNFTFNKKNAPSVSEDSDDAYE